MWISSMTGNYLYSKIISNSRYLEDKTEPYFFAKAVGYRVYISLHSTLADYYTQKEVMENKYEIHQYLQEMAQFYAENMTEGMRRQYADITTS